MFLSRSMGRLDVENVWAELTPYRLSLWRALYELEPWGEERADTRAALNTLTMATAVSISPLGDESANDAMRELQNYTPLGRKQVDEHYDDFGAVTSLLGGV